jgi:hypothetical protein
VTEPVARIALRNRAGAIRAWALVDQDRFDELNAVRWHFNSGYAVRWIPRPGGGQLKVRMHREVLGLERDDPRLADHVNGDTLDNRAANLRVVEAAGNAQNAAPRQGTTSRYRGVAWNREQQKWAAYGAVNKRRVHLGYFTNEDAAGHAAAVWRAENMPFAVAR